MKFQDALHKVTDDEDLWEDGLEIVITPQTSKILAILWNMVAVSKNVLDDIVWIDKNNNIISKPLQKSSTKKTTAKTAKKTTAKSVGKEKVEDKNGGKKSRK